MTPATAGFWDLRNNNITTTANFKTYGITWSSGGTKDASDWTTTAVFPKTLSYTYEPVTAQCVKDKLASYAGVGKNLAQLSASACSGSSSSAASSSAASSSSSKSSASSSKSSSSSSKASSSAASSASSSSKSSSSSANTPTLSGSGDYPDGFTKCADVGKTCSVKSGTGWVSFGRKGKWVVKYVGAGKTIACTVAAFGSDPGGDPDKCAYQK